MEADRAVWERLQGLPGDMVSSTVLLELMPQAGREAEALAEAARTDLEISG